MEKSKGKKLKPGKPKNALYSKLPEAVSSCLGIKQHDGSSPTIETFLESAMIKSDPKLIADNMHKTFPLQKRKEKTPRNPRQKKTFLSLTERKKLGLYNLPRHGLKYQDLMPLHDLWESYMRGYLNIEGLKAHGFTGKPTDREWDQFSLQLLKADYHGAVLTVTRSKCSSFVGQSGIVVFDTKNTFKLLGSDNIVRTVPKETNVFSLSLDVFTFTIFGKNLCIRPAERSVKKIKSRLMADL